MKLRIEKSRSYLNSTNWTLVVTFRDGTVKRFLLGQDIKFVQRILGYEFESFLEVLELIGKDKKIKWNDRISQKIGNFIKKDLGLSEKFFKEADEWELACQ
jgi:hypothetical protein